MNTVCRVEAELLLFDLDGTLIDSSTDIAWAANRTLESMGHTEMDVESIKANIGWGVKVLLERLMPGEPPSRIEEGRARFLEFYSTHLVVNTFLYPGVEETVSHFHSSGKKMGVVTNKPEKFARAILEELDIGKFFHLIVGGDTYPNRKPHPEPVLRAMEELKGDKGSTVLIGDSPIDCEAGKTAGVKIIGVSYGFRDKADLTGAQCDIIVERFSDLKGVIA